MLAKGPYDKLLVDRRTARLKVITRGCVFDHRHGTRYVDDSDAFHSESMMEYAASNDGQSLLRRMTTTCKATA